LSIDEATLKQLEEMSWKRPREEDVKAREDEFDDYFKDMLF